MIEASKQFQILFVGMIIGSSPKLSVTFQIVIKFNKFSKLKMYIHSTNFPK